MKNTKWMNLIASMILVTLIVISDLTSEQVTKIAMFVIIFYVAYQADRVTEEINKSKDEKNKDEQG